MRFFVLLAAVRLAALAADPVPVAAVLLEDIHAANAARTASESERNAWTAERERLSAIHQGVVASAERLALETATAERETAALAATLQKLTAERESDEVRQRLTALAGTIRTQLAALAQTLPPGVLTVPPPGSDIATMLRALDAAERTANSVSVDIVTGELAGAPVAIRLLRISAAGWWWASLDQQRAGTATVRPGAIADASGTLVLTAIDDPMPIVRAIAQAEGRAQACPSMLPLAELAPRTGAQP